MDDMLTGPELRSTATADGRMVLALEDRPVGNPAPGEVVVEMEAAPINPSDLGLLLGPADMATLEAGGTTDRPTLTAAIPAWSMAAVRSRLDRPMPVGNEGAGTVVRAGAQAAHLLGRKVGLWGGGTYARYRRIAATACIPLPGGAEAADGAAMFVNPLTALGFTETLKAEGHRAMIHYAAASNLGRMLNRICIADGIPLINVVRSDAQAALLRDDGAAHVLDMTADDFDARLEAACAQTGATLAFDPIGGGRQATRSLAAMEAAASRGAEWSRYGSDTHKQVYIYGALDLSPTVLDRWVGFAWSVGGWLLTPFLQRQGPDGFARLAGRVSAELTTTFASGYTRTIGLAEALDPDVVRAYNRKSTGEKFLLDPRR